MASFASQLKDMFFALVECVTGYGGATATGELPVAHPHEIRPRGAEEPIVSEGSVVQVN
ncbi:unnamed protein product [Urochloa decumbens]|uniref:Uncharacterized protein n=1 Tax=Urochloa decumbens TaxID=240449 RepID=A0ABC9CS71_9POAL